MDDVPAAPPTPPFGDPSPEMHEPPPSPVQRAGTSIQPGDGAGIPPPQKENVEFDVAEEQEEEDKAWPVEAILDSRGTFSLLARILAVRCCTSLGFLL